MWNKITRLYHTLKYLKPTQFYFRGFYFLGNKIMGNTFQIISYQRIQTMEIQLNEFPKNINSFHSSAEFTFLNQSKDFKSIQNIDWNYNEFGKLWCYNLNYFDFLLQKNISKEDGLFIIRDYISKIESHKDGLEPYTISLRNINWIKFVLSHKINDQSINSFIYSSALHLKKNLEFHLLGNHLLENGFSLAISGVFLQDESLYNRGIGIVRNELQEQILSDGGHFELSPMYHQILTERLLDLINFSKGSHSVVNTNDIRYLEEICAKMLSWLRKITFEDGSIPLLNDSALDIAKTSDELFKYADLLGLTYTVGKLKDSGYRKFESESFQMVIDAGKPGPDYIPGHAHADIGSFVLYYNDLPFVIDPGVSTYEKNEQRNEERSTHLHNTVVVANKNQSDVWGGFRLGKRARVKIENENENSIHFYHDGYKDEAGLVSREINFDHEIITIKDNIAYSNKEGIAYFHFASNVSVKNIDEKHERVLMNNGIKLSFSGSHKIKSSKYNCPQGFNKYTVNHKLAIYFKGELITRITSK
jgi:hypothetical protein